MSKKNQMITIIALAMLITIVFICYRFHQRDSFFEHSQSTASIDTHDFFDYNKKQSGKKS